MRLAVVRLAVLLAYAGVQLPVCAAPLQVKRLTALVQSADLIVVGTLSQYTPAQDGLRFSIQIDRVLKGDAVAGQNVAVKWIPPLVQKRDLPTTGARGLWFFQTSAPGEVALLPVDWNWIEAESLYYPISSAEGPKRHAYGASTAVLEKVISELADAAENSNSQALAVLALRLPFAISDSESPLLASIYRDWADSSIPDLKAMGLYGQIGLGDPAAVVRAEQSSQLLARSPAVIALGGAIGGFRLNDPNAVAALGRLAVLAGPSSPFRNPAVYALAAIHSLDTLPYLAQLLDDPDAEARIVAIAGISLFATSARIARPGMDEAWALDEVMNPANIKRRTLASGVDPRYLHFGKFQTPQDENKYVTYWKNWIHTYLKH